MKKSASLLLVLLLALFSFTACGGEESSSVVSSDASVPSSSVLESSLPVSSLPESTAAEEISAEDSKWENETWSCFFQGGTNQGHTSFEVCSIKFFSDNELKISFGIFESESDYSFFGDYYWDGDKLVIEAVDVHKGIFDEGTEDSGTLKTTLQVENNGDMSYTVTLVEGDSLHPHQELGVPEIYYHRLSDYNPYAGLPNESSFEQVAGWTAYYENYNGETDFLFVLLYDDFSAFVSCGSSEETVSGWAFRGEYSWPDDTTLDLDMTGWFGTYIGEVRNTTLSVVDNGDHTVTVTLLDGDALHPSQKLGIAETYFDDIQVANEQKVIN